MIAVRPVVALLTDYGPGSEHVGALHAVIAARCPEAQRVDLAHDIPPGDVRMGALVLARMAPLLPAAIHLAVVDPGVGGPRTVLAGRWAGQTIVAPNNGLVDLIQQTTPADEIYEVGDPDWAGLQVSATFHGRDIMAPLAAHLANGRALCTVGPVLHPPLNLPQPQLSGTGLIGEVIHIDHFGNLVTNIAGDRVTARPGAKVVFKQHPFDHIHRTYSDRAVGMPLALIGSSGLLEIAVTCGSAAAHFAAAVGDPVRVDCPS